MEGNHSHYNPGNLSPKQQNTHFWDSPFRLYWNQSFRTGMFTMALLFTIVAPDLQSQSNNCSGN